MFCIRSFPRAHWIATPLHNITETGKLCPELQGFYFYFVWCSMSQCVNPIFVHVSHIAKAQGDLISHYDHMVVQAGTTQIPTVHSLALSRATPRKDLRSLCQERCRRDVHQATTPGSTTPTATINTRTRGTSFTLSPLLPLACYHSAPPPAPSHTIGSARLLLHRC